MEWYEAGALIVGLLLVFMALSIPVAFSFFAVSVVGMLVFIGGEAGLAQITANVTSSVTLFVPIPLFLPMGELFFHTGLRCASSTRSTRSSADCRDGCRISPSPAAPCSRRCPARAWAAPRCSPR